MNWSVTLNLVSTLALVGAVLFAGVQVRQGNRTRTQTAAIELIRSMQSDAWTSALGVLSSHLGSPQLPLTSEQEEAAIAIGVRLETLGYLVFRHIIPLQVAEDLVGGVTRNSWSVLRNWVFDGRKATKNAKSYEWFQWLAEQLRQTAPSRPAYEKRGDWEK